MKRLALWCLMAFLSSVCVAVENQWYVGVQRASIPLAPFRQIEIPPLPVEYLRQKGPLCLSTAAAVALRYYGMDVEPARIRELGKWDPVTGKRRDFDDGSTFDQIEDVVRRWNYRWSVRSYPANQEGFRVGMVEIHEQLAFGHPVIVGVYFGGGECHATLVYGYDDQTQLVYILDSALPPPGKRLVTCDEFEMVWTFGVVGNPVRMAMFTSPQAELPAVLKVSAVSPVVATPQPPPPSPPVELPASLPSGEPEKTADHQPGGFRGHGFRSPLRAKSLSTAEQTAGEKRVPLKPFLPSEESSGSGRSQLGLRRVFEMLDTSRAAAIVATLFPKIPKPWPIPNPQLNAPAKTSAAPLSTAAALPLSRTSSKAFVTP